MIRIGFAPHLFGAGWMGGISYLRNLFSALGSLAERKIEPVLLVRPLEREHAVALGGVVAELGVPGYLDPRSGHAARLLAALAPLSRRLWQRFLAAEDISGLSHSPASLAPPSLPSLGIIYDFQHRHLPELFSAEERAARDRAFLSLCKASSTVLVSSECALSDLRAFCPDHAHKGRVLHFVANLEGTAPTPLAGLRAKYGLPPAYLYLPNQFWKHKNHAAAIRALAVLRKKGAPPVWVVASGAAADYRHPRHYSDLMAMAGALGVQDSFRSLGVVPYADLLGLMQHAVAVLNPSLFEGWSTTVEEAKSMGKLVILSRIPVHLEQSPARSLFFDPDSPEELADAMSRAAGAHSEAEEARCLAKAGAELAARVRSYALAYQNLALATLAGARGAA
jgi:glycosyltransferase involved in cell wall biosynthesis